MVGPGSPVLIVVPDTTRNAAAGQIVNLAVRRLIAAGTAPFDISIIFATGMHRRVTQEERKQILSPFIVQRIKILDHDPRDLARLIRVGETSCGIPVELNRAIAESGSVITVGGIGFDYFAGFTGGRKMICPGLASSRTIMRTHELAFDCDTNSRRGGVGPGVLEGNAVHEAFAEAADLVENTFAINTIVNETGEATEIFCGSMRASHRAACDTYAAGHTVRIEEKRDLVVASCGGAPKDLDLIQAHQALEAASRACTDGGTIILLAECRNGLGRAGLLDWFNAESSSTIAKSLCQKYSLTGQTAWSISSLTERFNVIAITELSEEVLGKMGIRKEPNLSAALKKSEKARSAFILPLGSAFLPVVR